jgi:hypothetical protein
LKPQKLDIEFGKVQAPAFEVHRALAHPKRFSGEIILGTSSLVNKSNT